MDTNLSLFNQISSLSYWFMLESSYKSSVILDADKDTFFVNVKKANQPLYATCITHFSKKNKNFLKFEMIAIVNSLLHIKESIEKRKMQQLSA